MTPLEAVAKAICDTMGDHPDVWQRYIPAASSALKAAAENVGEEEASTFWDGFDNTHPELDDAESATVDGLKAALNKMAEYEEAPHDPT